MPNTTKGYPYPAGSDAVDVPGDIQALADAVDAAPGVTSYTSTQIAALAAGDKWAGRVVYNSTTGRLQVSNGSTFSDVDSTTLSSTNPQALGVAAPGTSSDASRADHVHVMPTASQVGAPSTSVTISAGNGLTGGGDLSANRTLSANFSATNPAMNGTAGAGSANAVSRGDHVHPSDTTRAPLASPTFTGTPAAPTAAADTNTTQIATTAYVIGQAASTNPAMNGAVAVGTSTRYARADHVHASDTSRAPLASPTFTGTPAAPTAAADTNTTQVATTAYVVGQASATNPAALGSVAVGTSLRYARQDHVHPTTGLGLTSGKLSQFAATTSAELAGVISDETGSGALVFGTAPTLSSAILASPEERCNVVASAATGTINLDALTASVWFYTSNASANHTLNIRGNSSNTLNSILATGDSITVVWMNTNGATAYYPNVVQVDGSTVTPKWQGGSAPTAGNASSIDVYTFTVIKTAATPTYTVLGVQTQFK